MSDIVTNNTILHNLKLSSGKRHVVTVQKNIIRKVSFENIKIIEDTDMFSHGEFIFHALIDGVSIGKSNVIYADTGDTVSYAWSMGIKHADMEPLLVEFRADELETATTRIEIARFSATFTKSDNSYGIGKHTFSNDYLEVHYKIEEMTLSDFQRLSQVSGTVTSKVDNKAVKDAVVIIYESDGKTFFEKSGISKGWITDKFVKTDAAGKFELKDLAIDKQYQLKITAKGLESFTLDINKFPQVLEVPLTQPIISGKVIKESDKTGLSSVRIDLYKATLRFVNEKLKVYEEADTKSKILITLDKSDFTVVEIPAKYPDFGSETDYIKISFESGGKIGEGWVCTRWEKDHYALLFEKKEGEGKAFTAADGTFSIKFDGNGQLYKVVAVLKNYFDTNSDWFKPGVTDLTIAVKGAEKSVQESAIINRISDFTGFVYRPTGEVSRYPYEMPDIHIKVAPPKQNDCCTFVEGLIVKAWKDTHSDKFTWSSEKHNQFMILAADVYSPITAAVESDMADEINSDNLPPVWTLVQGWKKNPATTDLEDAGGHTFLIVNVHSGTERVLTLESNKAYGMDGPGFRVLGDIDDFTNCCPGNEWWGSTKLWDWSQLKDSFKFRKMARLRVYDVKWVK